MSKTEELKNFIAKCKRVWLVLKKPTKEEYWSVAKIASIGVLILGVLGFLISITMKMFS